MEMNRKGIRAYQARLLRERKKTKVQQLPNGKVRVLHPTKGFRDRRITTVEVKETDQPLVVWFKTICNNKLGAYRVQTNT